MHKLYIQSLETRFLDPFKEKDELQAFTSNLPRRAARRMSTLGILVASVLEDISLDLDTTVIYGTTFTEARALEKFLESIPYASPTAFQTSIHPGGIEQALILRKQSMGAFFPIAGEKTLPVQMLKAAFSAGTPKSLLCGGEESGGWLRKFDVAYPLSYAFSIELSGEPEGALFSVEWDPDCWDENKREFIPSMETVIRLLRDRETVILGGGDHGRFQIFPA